MGAFEFVIVASLRAAQLMRGCRPKVEGLHKNTIIAQLEVAHGRVSAQSVDAGAEPFASSAIHSEAVAQPAISG